MQQVMQQAIYTNAHNNTPGNSPGNMHAVPGHGTGSTFDADGTEPQERRFKKLRLVFSVAGNVLGGTLLLSGMLMLPQLFVSLLEL